MANSNMVSMLPLIFIMCLLFPPPRSCKLHNQTDLLSLLAFKSAIDLDPQGALSSWNRTTHFCSWKGIKCGRRHPDRVVELNLRSQGLVGSLSPHIGNLSLLRTIILQNNTFHGPIPTEISLLRRLEIVILSNNSFSGAIPRNLSRCPNLVLLNLIDNKLSGTIPAELGSLSKLENLSLSRNILSGPLPPFIGNITSLRVLSLALCSLKGEIPESFVRLQSLTFLQLSANDLAGTIPSGLFNISSIRTFSFYHNNLRGVIPSTIGLTLPNLRRFQLSENQFSGPIPGSIANASSLEQIDFQSNYFTGPMPRAGKLAHLTEFLFSSNLIRDDISFISSLTNSTELFYLEVFNNMLTGSLPDSVANLSVRLSSLYLNENQIHGNIPSGIGNLIGLTSVALYDNQLEGPIPTDIAKLSNLHYLLVERNRFTNELPSSLGNLTSLNRLYLNENRFSGILPSTIGNCTDLLELNLAHNDFSGLIPLEVLSLSSISIIFDVSYNYFEGSIPLEVGSLTNLQELDLSNNRLSGRIPVQLARCISLQQLYLEGNSLEGEIPSTLSALKGLQDLDLSRNNFSGPIPSFLERLDLERLNLSFNKLQGEVPTIGVFKNKSSVSLDGNAQLCGGIWDLKLPPCSSVKSQKKNLTTLLKILIPIGGICLVLVASFVYKKRRTPQNVTSFESSLTGPQFMRLSYADLVKATEGFLNSNLLGIGTFGSVYKGILDDGQTIVAIKVLNLSVRGASRSFMAECNALRAVRHRNLLKILSVCESIDFQGNDFKALVYEFKANGSLDKWLCHSKEEESAVTWKLTTIQRLNIAIDIAQALEYLHLGTDSAIVHGDLKPSNILLDHDMTAYVGDFGLAKIISNTGLSHESSSLAGIRGTIGYVAPEYATNNFVSTQGDIYSYGILLLEIFTNRRPTDEAFKDHVNLHNFVRDSLPDYNVENVDPSILDKNDTDGKVKDGITSILRIGIACSKEIPWDRMSITDVVVDLCKIRDYYLS